MKLLDNLGSFRVVGAAAAGAILPAALASAVWRPLGQAVAVAAFAVLYVGIASTTVLYCPHCFKGVKMGASVCHHCGREVV
jgi:hypothetical protein